MDESTAHLQFFGLRQEPFAPTADPAYFYAARHHKECLFHLWNTLDGRRGIAVVLGDYGTGKTTLMRKLCANMHAAPEKYVTAVIGSPLPTWNSLALLEAIVGQFGIEPPEATVASYMESLNEFLMARRDKTCTLIIDDAQNLNKRGQLELLRLLENLETQQHKLLNLALFAQIEWVDVLKAAPNFEQRISATCTLQPLSLEDLGELVAFRLLQAGAAPGHGPRFSEVALRALHAYTEGSPRLTVTLCRNSLLVAAEMNAMEISHDIVINAIERTTVPDAVKRARVAGAVMDAIRRSQRGATAGAAVSEPVGAARERLAREQRAADLLLKSTRPAGGE